MTTSLEDLVHQHYTDRTTNNVDTLKNWHTDEATFEMPNMPGEMGQPARITDLLDTLVKTFRWEEFDITDIHESERTATVRLNLTVTHIPSGQTHTTECLDLITFADDNRISKYVQYVDTALVTSLLAEAG